MNARIEDRIPAGIEQLRLPPHAIDAEQSVLGCLMLSPQSLPKIADWLSAEDFYRKDHRLIFKAITILIGRGSPVDTVTMMDWFDDQGLAEMIGGSKYLYEISDATPGASNLVAYAEIVLEKSKLRSAINIGTRLAEGAYSRGTESNALIAEAVRTLSTMQAQKIHGGLEPTTAAMTRMHAEIAARFERGPQLLGLAWPWAKLNECTKGLRDGVLYVVGARPSMGKSILALQTALHVALAGNRTAFFSVEMTAEECMARAVACIAEVQHDFVESPDVNDRDSDFFWSRISSATARIIESPLLIDETPSITIDQLMARARRAHMQSPLRFIVIDHMHDMQLDPKAEVRHEYGRIAQGAKTLAKELKCPVMLLAQLNRKNVGSRPSLADLRESGEIEQKADVVLFVHREDYYNADSHLKGLVEIIPAKGRNIRTGSEIDLQNIYSEMRLQDWIGQRPASPESRPENKYGRGFKAKGSST